MTLIEFIRTMDISTGWTTRGSYAATKKGKVKINVPIFLAEMIIHEHIHHTIPDADFDKKTCSSLIQRQAKGVMDRLSESALREIADEVCKAMLRHVRAKAARKGGLNDQ